MTNIWNEYFRYSERGWYWYLMHFLTGSKDCRLLINALRFRRSHNFVRRLGEILVHFLRRQILLLIQDHTRDSTKLECGCGEGFILSGLRGHVVGLDISKRALQINKETLLDSELIVADVYLLPFRDKSFDEVYLSEVIEHLERPIEAVVEMERIARRRVIVTTPNYNIPSTGSRDPTHIWSFSKGDLHNILGKTDVKIIEIPYFHIAVKAM